ncbi:MAG: DUF3850 domain-containing protein [Promethearchaeota archaeon]
MKIHELKVWPECFDLLLEGKKTFEIRKNDREFALGDLLVLKEYDSPTKSYTGREVRFYIIYMLANSSFMKDGFVIMSLERYHDPLKEVHEATLCLHCIHHNCCYVERVLHELLNKLPNYTFGNFNRKFDEVAEICIQYKRKELNK